VLKKLPPVLPGGAEQQKSIVQLTAPMMGIFAMGAPNMLGGLGRSATVVAVEDCDAIVVSKEAYERLCREDPLLGYIMTRNIAMQIIRDLNDTNARVVKLTQALTLALQKRQ
jgi:CRP-like cAMP-binding protein